MQTYIEILVDTSGSMGIMKGTEYENKYLLPDGSTRMTLVKKILQEQILPTLSYATNITIRTFHGDNNNNSKPVISEIYNGNFDGLKLINAIGNLPDDPLGGTPITTAINTAVCSLELFPNSDRKIILLTDGDENEPNGDYKKAAEDALRLKGIPCKIFVIGICQNATAEQKAKELSAWTKGAYVNLTSKIYDSAVITQALTSFKEKVVLDSLHNTQSISQKPTQQYVKQNSSATQSQFPTGLSASAMGLNEVSSQNQKRDYEQASFTSSKVSNENTSTNQKNIVEVLNQKLDAIKKDSDRANMTSQLSEMESKIYEQLTNTQKLLSEIISLKETIRLKDLLDTGISSTTLTIDEEYSEEIRRKSEEYLFGILVKTYGNQKIRWLNKDGETKSPHDFELIDDNGNIVNIIECKGTPKRKPTFYLTDNEWFHYLKNKDIYQIYRVYDVDAEMTFTCLENLHTSIMLGEVVPYLQSAEILRENRVFLTVLKTT